MPCPSVGRGQILIRTSRSLISAGTERMLIEFGKGNLIQKARSQPDRVKQVLDKIRTDGLAPTLEAVFRKLDEPLPLGYCNAGVVLEVGPDISDIRPGDRVISNGSHAEFVRASRNLTAKIPDNVGDEAAAFTVLGAVALQGIRLAKPELGERFMVFGMGILGLLTVQLLRTNGCEVMAVDLNAKRLSIAESFGAKTVNLSSGEDPVAAAMAWTGRIRERTACSSPRRQRPTTSCTRRPRLPANAAGSCSWEWSASIYAAMTSTKRNSPSRCRVPTARGGMTRPTSGKAGIIRCRTCDGRSRGISKRCSARWLRAL